METIFDYVKEQEENYSKPVELADGWDWSMKEHIEHSFLYLNGQFVEDNENRDLRPNKNIVLPILNIQHRTEGFDVKDIELYADNKDEFFKSLLIKKYHDKWALEEQIDTFIDEMVESYCNYGGVLVRKTKNAKPEVIDWKSVAFANQTDVLNSPFAILHEMSFSQLKSEAKARGWGGDGADIDIESLINLVKKEDKDIVEIYEVHGEMPIEWLGEESEEMPDGISKEDVNQVQIIAFYQDENNNSVGVSLFAKRMPVLPFKLLKRDDIPSRALGRGGVEELFEAQMWTNWNEVKITEMLDAASKTLFVSDDPTFKSRNNLNDARNNEVFSLQEGKSLGQMDTFPRNLPVFNEAVNRFWEHAQLVGAASDPLTGETPKSGTPFKLFEAQQVEGRGMHKYRQGKLAVFMDEIYRDWILPHLAKEIVKPKEFMQELSVDEMQAVADKVVVKKTNEFKKQMILGMQEVTPELVDMYEQEIRSDIAKGGNKRFFKILAGEMKDISIAVSTNIAGKQKNLALMTDKLVNLLRQYMAAPELRNDPEMGKLVNTVLESSGLSPIMFSLAPQQQPAQPQQAAVAPQTNEAPVV